MDSLDYTIGYNVEMKKIYDILNNNLKLQDFINKENDVLKQEELEFKTKQSPYYIGKNLAFIHFNKNLEEQGWDGWKNQEEQKEIIDKIKTIIMNNFPFIINLNFEQLG